MERDRAVEAACWAAVIALTAWSAWQRWEVLTLSPYPVGVDGWYYPIQIRALLERGELAYPAAPLTFWLMAPIAWICGDPIVAAKVVAAGGGALVAVPAFLLGRRVGGLAGGLVAAVLAVSAGGSFFLSLEFVKNGLGLTIGLTAAWLGLRALEAPARGRIALAFAALAAAALTHKMSLLVALALLGPAVVAELRARGVGPAVWRRLAIGAAVLAALALAAGLLAPRRFAGPADLALLDGAFTGPFEWRLPAMAVPKANGPTYHLWLGHQGLIAAAAAAAFVLAIVAERVRGVPPPGRPAERAMVWTAFALVAVTSWPALDVADPDALGFRLRVAVFAPAAIVAAAAVGRGLAALGLDAEWRAIAAAAALLVWLGARDPRPTEGMVDTEVPMVAATAALRGALPPDAVVISAERHLAFQAAWFARVPVRLRPESVPPARRWRMIPLGIIGFNSPLDQALRDARREPGLAPPIGLHPGHPNGLVLVPEATWEWVLGRLPPKAQRWWREWHTR